MLPESSLREAQPTDDVSREGEARLPRADTARRFCEQAADVPRAAPPIWSLSRPALHRLLARLRPPQGLLQGRPHLLTLPLLPRRLSQGNGSAQTRPGGAKRSRLREMWPRLGRLTRTPRRRAGGTRVFVTGRGGPRDQGAHGRPGRPRKGPRGRLPDGHMCPVGGVLGGVGVWGV